MARELLVLSVAAAILVLLGLWVGYPLQALAGGVVCYLTWHLAQLFRFNLWLKSPKQSKPPVGIGVWRSVLLSVEQLRERGRKRKRKLERMLRGFQESTSALPDATLVLNGQGKVEWWNGVATAMLGFKRKRDQGRRLDELISDPVFRSYLARGDYQRPLKMPAPVSDSINWRYA
jgi:two-component system phosphate regulon sensor histidine kinase PhoR